MADIVFDILQQMLQNSPEQSYRRLNPSLRSTLHNCIVADLPFQRDTFQRIFKELRGHWWFGDGGGSHVGEHFYSHAVAVNHSSAYQSFEKFAGRPGVLWEENSGATVRLTVGSEFTWQGYYVTVTSLRSDSLVACTYKDTRDSAYGIKIGARIANQVIVSSKRVGKGHILRTIKAPPNAGNRIVARRFTITYDEIAKFRRTENARLKKVLDKIAVCNPKKAASLAKEIAAEHFRHYQLEQINAAFAKRKDWIAGAAERKAQQKRIEAWRNGADGEWLDVKENLLRMVEDRVQCSNGNSVSVASVRRALPVVMDRRGETLKLNLPLDGHTINRIDPQGVKVGCTKVAWSEIEGIAKKL
jgi:hypothetical protein